MLIQDRAGTSEFLKTFGYCDSKESSFFGSNPEQHNVTQHTPETHETRTSVLAMDAKGAIVCHRRFNQL